MWPVGLSLSGRSWLPSVVGLLEQCELAARRESRGYGRRADCIQAELAAAEEEWRERAIDRTQVDTVLAPHDGNIAATEVTEDPRDADASPEPRHAATRESQVPGWREGLAWPALAVVYQRILATLAGRQRLRQGALTQSGAT
ncbi:hypothetical protein ACWDR3_06665 [Streptomyces sp. NPDC001002]